MTRMRRSDEDNGPEPTRCPDGGWEVKTFYPTMEEMKDFSKYMKHIHDAGGHRAGLVKIVPPSDYKPRKAGYDDESVYNMNIDHPIRQTVQGAGGLYQQLNEIVKKKMPVRNFKKLAEGKHMTPEHTSNQDLDRLFWKNIFINPSIYGADVPGTLYDDDCDRFNLTRLNTILDKIKDDYGVTIQGVNTTYLYFGMWKSAFSWHTEDMDLYSINYLHYGQPKSWYCIAPESGKRFERLAASFFPHSSKNCRAFLRHKTTLISPQVLRKYSIPFSRATQNAGEFMVTFPYSYHSGFNHGFNIAEATNFALEYWIDFGKWATRCECSTESVKISMQTFVKNYQSHRYEDWLRGKDVCKDPRDPKHVAAAPKPSEYDLYLMGIHFRDQDDDVDRDHDDHDRVIHDDHHTAIKPKTKRPVIGEGILKAYEEIYRVTQPGVVNPNETSDYATALSNSELTTDAHPLDTSGQIISPKAKGRRDFEKREKKRKREYERELNLRLKKEKKARERRVSSLQLLHYLPVSFTHEKRFNRCISSQQPHCSICQLLVLHPKDDDNIWEPQWPTTINHSSPTNQDTSNNNNNDDNNNMQHGVTGNTSAGGTTPPPPQQQQSVVSNPVVKEFQLPKTSRVLLPRSLFMRYPELTGCEFYEEAMQDKKRDKVVVKQEPQTDTSQEVEVSDVPVAEANKTLDPDYVGKLEFLDMDIDESELVQCSLCMLSVHKLCYGVDKIPENNKDWICDRCVEPNRSLINCALCPCRGGALKAISNVWVHVTCALSVKYFKFIDLIKPNDNSNLKLPDNVGKSTCYYCAKNMNMTKYVPGHCVSCIGHFDHEGQENQCSTTFHTTCGHRNGAKFDYFDLHSDPKGAQPIRAQCYDCFNNEEAIGIEKKRGDIERERAHLGPIKIGTIVIAKENEGNSHLRGVVTDMKTWNYFDVYYPELNQTDLEVREDRIINGIENLNGQFRIGDRLTVKGETDEDRTGKMKAHYVREECQVKFLATTEVQWIERKHVYSSVDEMPIELADQIVDQTKN